MKKIYIIITGILLCSMVNAQVLTNGSTNNQLFNTNYFLDASSFQGQADASQGKLLGFPKTDLTKFKFNLNVIENEDVLSGFDGVIVYNTVSGNIGENAEGGYDADSMGEQVAVEPGFYYFSNPNGADNQSVTQGKWIKISSEYQKTSGVVNGKNLVYVNNDDINKDLKKPEEGPVVEFDNVPSTDPNFTNDDSLEKNTEYIYITPNGVNYKWDPDYEWSSYYYPNHENGAYVQADENVSLGGNSNFYNANSFDDAGGNKGNAIFRPGRIGIAVQNPMSDIDVNGAISAGETYTIVLSVDNTKGDESKTDRVFNTLAEAIDYANTITNNAVVRIVVSNTTENIDKSLRINRDIDIYGSQKTTQTINLNASITVKSGVSFGFVEGYGMTINQNVPTAITCNGNNRISIGGYSAVTWNFTQPNQSLIKGTYSLGNAGAHVKLLLNRAKIKTNGNTGISWSPYSDVNGAYIYIGYWQSIIPEDIAYNNVKNITYQSSVDQSQNIVGSDVIFSGFDENGHLKENMRISAKNYLDPETKKRVYYSNLKLNNSLTNVLGENVTFKINRVNVNGNTWTKSEKTEGKKNVLGIDMSGLALSGDMKKSIAGTWTALKPNYVGQSIDFGMEGSTYATHPFISFSVAPHQGSPSDKDMTIERMRINDEGNVGIGTKTPTEKLEVAGNVKATKAIFTNLPVYVDDDAADADTNLPSGSLYKLESTGRQVFVKP